MHFYTRQKAVAACLIVPVFCICVYSWHGPDYFVNPRNHCDVKPDKLAEFLTASELLIMFYLVCPAIVLLVFNIAIIRKLRRIATFHKTHCPVVVTAARQQMSSVETLTSSLLTTSFTNERTLSVRETAYYTPVTGSPVDKRCSPTSTKGVATPCDRRPTRSPNFGRLSNTSVGSTSLSSSPTLSHRSWRASPPRGSLAASMR